MGKIDDRLSELGIALPDAPRPVAAYVPAVQTGNLVLTAGQIPLVEGKLCCEGVVGKNLTLELGGLDDWCLVNGWA
jgi:enamine deaminase RidA (YjgF/YER057c/UK114 family)